MEQKLTIKTEYITTDISYRKLAEKHGLRYATIQKWGQEENWPELRNQYRADVVSKTVRKIANQKAKQAAKIDSLADKLLVKVEQAIDELDLKVTTHKIKTEVGNTEQTTEFKVATEGGTVDRAGLRQLTAALRELKEIKGELSDLDRQEQEARIANLRKQADKDINDLSEVEVIFLAGEEAWNE